MKLSDRQIEALIILNSKESMSATEFGLLFWPNHPTHEKITNNSYGAQCGKGGWLMAGSYLGKLRKRGLVRYAYSFEPLSGNGFVLTPKAKDFLIKLKNKK